MISGRFGDSYMLLNSILLIFGFFILVKGADLLVDGASVLAQKFALPQIVIGLTIVAFGTSAPELVVNLVAAFQNRSDISLGNIVGSNIINTLLILGVAGLIYPIRTQKNTVWREIPFAVLTAIVLVIVCNDRLLDSGENIVSRGEGILLFLFFLIFLTYSFAVSKVESQDSHDVRQMGSIRMILYIFLGVVGLFFGGKLVVDNAVEIAQIFHLSDKLIGLTIIAIGTSLPELFTSAVAAYKKKSDIAFGNIIGSNIFNVFLVLSLTAMVRPLPFDTVMNTDILVLLVATMLLFFWMFTGKKRSLDRWEAVIFLTIYVIYTTFLIIRN
jgi:cation:H+ antiporter